VLRVDQSVNL